MRGFILKIIIVPVVVLTAGLLQAQGLAPYLGKTLSNNLFRQLARQPFEYVETAWLHNMTAPAYEGIMKDFTLSPAMENSLLTTFDPYASSNNRVKTTDHNWIYSRIYYSDVFSIPEKALLLEKSGEKINLGKVAYLYDRNAAIHNHVSSRLTLTDHDQSAFQKHQDILKNLYVELEAYYQDEAPNLFRSAIFSKEEIKKLAATTPFQPPAFIFAEKIFADFAALPSLVAQRVWIDELQNTLKAQLQNLLTTPHLSNQHFIQYYTAKKQLKYVTDLKSVLQKSTDKRPSFVLRYKQKMDGLSVPATDAQRLGYLQLMADKFPESQYPQLLHDMSQLYAPYAVAEVFQLPYETVLKTHYCSEALLPYNEGNFFRQTDFSRWERILTPKIKALQAEKEALRAQPVQDLSLYVRYYRLQAQLNIYETLLAKAKFLLNAPHE